MSESNPRQRLAWRDYESNESNMARFAFGPIDILVARPTVDAWRALAAVLNSHRYTVRDIESYNDRQITGGADRSLHAYGIAIDINWAANPYKETPDGRRVEFSDKETQSQRGQDVKFGLADTDMSREMIADALAIKTNGGKAVFAWGGNWISVKDAMHFEIDVTPEELASGIDWKTVRGLPGASLFPDRWAQETGQYTTGPLAAGIFKKIHALVEKWGGGLLRDAPDLINRGVTQEELTLWRRRPASLDDLRNLTREEAQEIFFAKYWTVIRGEELPLPIAQVVYNVAVLSGPKQAILLLQGALKRQDNRIVDDGNIDADTIAACRGVDQIRLIEDYCEVYKEYLHKNLPDFEKFERSWLTRLAEIKQTALETADPLYAINEAEAAIKDRKSKRETSKPEIRTFEALELIADELTRLQAEIRTLRQHFAARISRPGS